MIVTWTGKLHLSDRSGGADKPRNLTFRTLTDGSLSVDGEAIAPDAKGISTVDLTPTQTLAFRAVLTGPAADLVAVQAAQSIALPDSYRGRQTVIGSDFGSFVAAAEAAEAAAAEAAEAAQTDADAGSTDEAAPEADPEPEVPQKRSKRV